MEMTVNTDIQAVVLGFQSALAAIEGDSRIRNLPTVCAEFLTIQ